MFTWLYETILPFVGDFFGISTSIAMTSVQWWLNSIELVIDGINDSILISYGNFFTGIGFSGIAVNILEIPCAFLQNAIVGTIFYNLISWFFSFFLFFDISAPLFIALPISIAIWGFLIAGLGWLYRTILFFLTN